MEFAVICSRWCWGDRATARQTEIRAASAEIYARRCSGLTFTAIRA
jgi:hypothetical protein